MRTERRILDYAAKHYPGRFTRIDVRFRGALCYIDVYTEPDRPRRIAPPTGETREQWIERLRNTPHTSLPDSILRERRPLELRVVYLRPRKVRTQLLDHRRRSRHTGRSFRDVSPLLLKNCQALRQPWIQYCRLLYKGYSGRHYKHKMATGDTEVACFQHGALLRCRTIRHNVADSAEVRYKVATCGQLLPDPAIASPRATEARRPSGTLDGRAVVIPSASSACGGATHLGVSVRKGTSSDCQTSVTVSDGCSGTSFWIVYPMAL
jgi:hypothetical protein